MKKSFAEQKLFDAMLELLEQLTTTCCDDAAKIASIQENAKLILKKARGEK